jgi:hypothetical protein
MLVKQLTLKFGDLDEPDLERIEQADAAVLETDLERVLTADSIRRARPRVRGRRSRVPASVFDR